MPWSNSDLPGSVPYLKWDYRDQQWTDMNTTENGMRFVVYGVVVPEPNIWALLVLAVGVGTVLGWRPQNTTTNPL